MAAKKTNKDFVISDSRVNVYGYRLLTSGYIKEEFLKNPVGYYNHKIDGGVLLKWDNLRIEGDNIVASPTVNTDHPRAEQTLAEVANGFLRGASVGRVCVLECTLEDNPADKNDPTLVVTKWYNKECSLVDIPGNRGAFAI